MSATAKEFRKAERSAKTRELAKTKDLAGAKELRRIAETHRERAAMFERLSSEPPPKRQVIEEVGSGRVRPISEPRRS
jgi:hypothetical protein